MTPSGIATALTRGPTMDNHIGGVRQLPSPDEVARLGYHVYEMNGRRTVTTSKTGSGRNENSRAFIQYSKPNPSRTRARW